MALPRRGRPPNPLEPDASHAAKLGAEIRARRTDAGLTLEQLAKQISFTPQYISEVERAKATPALAFVAAVDRALHADGALERLLPPVLQEREERRQERAEARRAAKQASLPCDEPTHSEVAGDDKDVQPTDRRGVIRAGAAAALGSAIVVAPAAAREVDPELPAHYTRLLAILGAADDAHGPHEVMAVACHELRVIAEHRAAARGDLSTDLMRVEARWATHAGWLCEDAGDRRARDALLERAVCLARESGYPDVLAWARARQAQWSDAPRAIQLAEAALYTPGASPQARVLCATRAAHAHARVGASESVERMIAEAETLAAKGGRPAPLSRNMAHDSQHDVRCWEARCWGELAPAKAIRMYDDVLRHWPRGEARDGGLFRARLATVCADAGELDRARAEGAKALAIFNHTRSATAARELKRLQHALAAA